VIKLQTRCKI